MIFEVGMRVRTTDSTAIRTEYRIRLGWIVDSDSDGLFILFDDASLNTNDRRQDRAMRLMAPLDCLVVDEFVIEELDLM